MKPLKILLGNNTLSLLAGSETWTYTLALELKKMGHHVACFAPELGIISDKLIAAGVPCFNNLQVNGVAPFSILLEEKIDHDYDVIISNHNHVVEFLRSSFPRKPIISTIHGIIHIDDAGNKAPEHPALEAGVNQFVSVSEEVQAKLKTDYNLDSVVIRNFFDMERYANIKPPSEKPKQFLVNTNYSDSKDPFIVSLRAAAKMMGARLAAVGQNFSQQFDLTQVIEGSDVVFGMGRSVLEGVAAGRLGFVYGRWGFGGPITEGYLNELRHFNFSGRNAPTNEPVTPERIVELVTKYYQPSFLDWGKKYVAREHNVKYAAEEYVRIARSLLGLDMVRPSRPAGVDPAARPFKLASSNAPTAA